MSLFSWLFGSKAVAAPDPIPAPVIAPAPPPALEFAGPATPATPGAYSDAARALGCSLAQVMAVATVETESAPFLPDGRPDILFEAGVFHEITKGRFADAKDRHGVALSSPTWNRALYGAGGAHQYERLEDAMKLDRSAALQSASWGQFQIMGENYKLAGFPDVESFVAAQCVGVDAHIAAFAAFCRAKGLGAALAKGDYRTFALHYNGSGQVDDYAGRIAKAVGGAK